MSKALINGISVHYQTQGSGREVVLIHGITSCLAQWYVNFFPELSPHYRVTAYDLRGHGLSQLTECGYSSTAMAVDLLALLDHLKIGRANIIGHSFGGAIALHAALLRPERIESMVLLDTGLACLRHLRTIQDWPGWHTHGSDLASFGITLEHFLEIDKRQDVTDFIRQSLGVPLQAGFRKGQSALTPRIERLLSGSRIGSEFREIAGLTEEALTSIQAPVLALYGGTSPYEKMAAHLNGLLPNCRYELLQGAGHFYAVEEPSLVLDRVAGFLVNPLEYIKRSATSSLRAEA